MIYTPIDVAGLKEADKLSRYFYAPLLRLFHEKEIWLIVGSAFVLTFARLTGQSHESWHTIFLMYGIGIAFLLLRYFYLEFRLRSRVKKLNRGLLGIELTFQGVRFHDLDGRVRLASWETYLKAKTGKQVLILFFRSPASKLSRQKYFIVPLRELSPTERTEVLLEIPERIRDESIQRALASWRLR